MALFNREGVRKVAVQGAQGYGGQRVTTYAEEGCELRLVTGTGRELSGEVEAQVTRPKAQVDPDVAWKVTDRLVVGSAEYEVEGVVDVEGNGAVDHKLLDLRKVGT